MSHRQLSWATALCPPVLLAPGLRPHLAVLHHQHRSAKRSARIGRVIQAALSPAGMLSGLKNILGQVRVNFCLFPSISAHVTTGTDCLSPFLNVQNNAKDYGARNFSDNAPSWDALQKMVEQQAKDLDWQKPNLEEVCACVTAPAVSPKLCRVQNSMHV